MAIPVWPLGLPNPLFDGFQRRPKSPFTRTDMDDGSARHRRRFRVFPIEVSVNFLLSSDQYDEYTEFCLNTINGYSDWFMVTVTGPGGIGLKRVRWLEPPSESPIVGGHWRISGQVETMSNF